MKKLALFGVSLFSVLAVCAAGPAPECLRGLELMEKGDYAAAAEIFCNLAEKGDLTARKQLAIMKFHGTGVPRDRDGAFKLFSEVIGASADKECRYYAGIMLISGKYAVKDEDLGLKYLLEAAAHKEDDPGDRRAQYLCAILYKDKYDFRQYSYYMELAAGQDMFEAWMSLGKHYAAYSMYDALNNMWAQRCFEAAMKLNPTAEAEYHAGVSAIRSRDFRRGRQLLQSASEKGSDEAEKMLRSGELERLEKRWRYFQAHEHLWPATSPALINTGSHKMLLLPLDPALKFPGWEFVTNRERENFANAMTDDLHSSTRIWVSEEFNAQPLKKNISNRETVLLMINEKYNDAFMEFMENSGYAAVSAEERAALVGFLRFGDPNLTASSFTGDKFYKLREGLYFYIRFTDGIGSKYQFITRSKEGKFSRLITFDTPPDKVDAALVAGILAGDPAALNNFAVELAREYSGFSTAASERAEELFKKLAAGKHPVATYNLAVFYQNRARHEEAEKYFALAEKFTGSSVISYHVQRPEIFDRNGKLLVKNRFYLPKASSRSRVYLQDGLFAANLIGHTSVARSFRESGAFGRNTEDGMGGIEEMMDRQGIWQNIYLTIDTDIQLQLDKFAASLGTADPRYAYAALVSADGELIAASQTPGFDVIKRDHVYLSPSAEKYLEAFLPAAYLLPVPDQWMRLLGSSSDDVPENKAKFGFHIREGIFPAEAQGLVPGLNCRLNEDRSTLSGQSATMLKFLCAYIGCAEKSAVPQMKYLTFQPNTPVKIGGKINWISFYRPPDGIVVNALGTVKSTSGRNLYLMVRFVPMERQYGKKVPAEVIQAAAKKADNAEKMIRNFNFATEK